MGVETAKKLLREEIWTKLEVSDQDFHFNSNGRIPIFARSEKAAENVRLSKA